MLGMTKPVFIGWALSTLLGAAFAFLVAWVVLLPSYHATAATPPTLQEIKLRKKLPMFSLLARDGHTKIFVTETDTGVDVNIVNLTPRVKVKE
ncbi:MAG TPA: hypothetical protein VEP90_23195 [Methylomirabilota bacterium]|nr:hypothetical protein [Methylomirabilota bacterium]